MHLTVSVCPVHIDGGAGHDSNFPLCISMVLVNLVLNMVDICDSKGRKGPVDI